MTSAIHAVWAATATAISPALRLMLRRRANRGKEIAARLPERRGIDQTKRPEGKLLWLHAASIGESVSVLPVLQALPDYVTTLLTTGTVTSARLLAQRLPELGLADRVLHRFVPLDVPHWAARFLNHWQPDAAAFMESELWPNLLAACVNRKIPLALLNARMSVRSATWWCNAPGFAREILGRFAWVTAQSEADAKRLTSLGALHVTLPGNLKFHAPALEADLAELARLLNLVGDHPRWVAASTHPGDEARIAGIHTRLAPAHPGLITTIVPRHPERGAALAAEFSTRRRALGQDPPGSGIWLADTLGELGLIYRLFPIVFMGKSFAPGGGQNPLEPARLGCAIATGPATENFADVVSRLTARGGLMTVADADELAAWVDTMLRDPAGRAAAGARARQAAGEEHDLPAQLAARLVELMA
jgi:3-deoxy-D-manno-octulosonic-acid transferase